MQFHTINNQENKMLQYVASQVNLQKMQLFPPQIIKEGFIRQSQNIFYKNN